MSKNRAILEKQKLVYFAGGAAAAAENWTAGPIPLFHLIRIIPAEGSVFRRTGAAKAKEIRSCAFSMKIRGSPSKEKKGE